MADIYQEQGKPINPEEVIKAVQEAIVKFVIDPNTCPPLARVAYENKKPDGTYNWDQMQEIIKFEVVGVEDGSFESLVERGTEKFLEFYKALSFGKAPLAYTIIFPEIEDNFQYDQIAQSIIERLFDIFIQARRGNQNYRMIDRIINECIKYSGQDINSLKNMEKIWDGSNDRDRSLVLVSIMEVLLGPVYFYGKTLEDPILKGMESDRGHVDRQRVLSRLPFHALQIVNPGHKRTKELSGSLNRNILRIKNTTFALNILNLDQLEFEITMDNFRKKVLDGDAEA